jgi:hypothetical protein
MRWIGFPFRVSLGAIILLGVFIFTAFEYIFFAEADGPKIAADVFKWIWNPCNP